MYIINSSLQILAGTPLLLNPVNIASYFWLLAQKEVLISIVSLYITDFLFQINHFLKSKQLKLTQ